MGCNCHCKNKDTHAVFALGQENTSSPVAGCDTMSVEGIIDLAVKIEKAGQKFYSSLAIFEYNEKIKDLLVLLAGEEAKHITAFENLGKVLKDDSSSAGSCSRDYADYLNCIVRAHMFFNMDLEDADYKVDTARETLELALKFERDSIMVFQEMKEVVGAAGKEVLEKLIDQERGHILKLSHSFNLV